MLCSKILAKTFIFNWGDRRDFSFVLAGNWMEGWMTGWLVGRLAGWLVGWLAGLGYWLSRLGPWLN